MVDRSCSRPLSQIGSSSIALLGLTFLLLLTPGQGTVDAKRLYDNLFRRRDYSTQVPPVTHAADTLNIKLGLKLLQLMNVDEKNNVVSARIMIMQEWYDSTLHWIPAVYGGISSLEVATESLWVPDIMLYNNADGAFNAGNAKKANVKWNGRVRWDQYMICNFMCEINIRYFPFDKQHCSLKFGSKSYDGYKLNLFHVAHKENMSDVLVVEDGIDLNEYSRSAEWDILQVTAKKNVKYYPCCSEPFPDITFNVTMRRKPLYQFINLIVPCLALNILVLFSFFLPCDSGEKVGFTISIFLSLSIFQILLIEMMPATSAAIPLLGAYILFTTCMATAAVFCSVVVLNIHHRSSSTHVMSGLTRWLLLDLLPMLVFMKRPAVERDPYLFNDRESRMMFPTEDPDLRARDPDLRAGDPELRARDPECPMRRERYIFSLPQSMENDTFCDACYRKSERGHDYLAYIAKHLDEDNESKVESEEWKFAAMVVDRFLFWICFITELAGTLGILLNAPELYDNTSKHYTS